MIFFVGGLGSGLLIESKFSGRVGFGIINGIGGLNVAWLNFLKKNNLEITSRFCKSLGFSKLEISHFGWKKLANSAASHRNLLIFFDFPKLEIWRSHFGSHFKPQVSESPNFSIVIWFFCRADYLHRHY